MRNDYYFNAKMTRLVYKDTQFESLFETGEIKERKNGRGRKRKILIMSNKPSGCVCVDLFVCVCVYVSNQFYV